MRRAKRPIAANDRSIKGATHEPGERTTERKIEGIPGLWLYIYPPTREYPKGRKTFHVHYSVRIAGKQVKRKPGLGDYGGAEHGITLEVARRRALAITAQVAEGLDPVKDAQEKQVRREREALTFADLVADYIADHRKQGHVTTDEVERALKKLLKDDAPELAKLQPSKIAGGDIQKAIDGVRDRVAEARGESGRGEMARRCLRYLKQVFNHALLDNEELASKYGLTTNPAERIGRSRASKIGRYGKAKPRERYLDDVEIVAFWRALDGDNAIDRQTKWLLKLLLLTAARLSELRCADIAELDLDGTSPSWEMPAIRARKRKDAPSRFVPLSPMAVTLFKEAIGNRKNGPVFASAKAKDGFLGRHTAGQAIKRLLTSKRLNIAPFTPMIFDVRSLQDSVGSITTTTRRGG